MSKRFTSPAIACSALAFVGILTTNLAAIADPLPTITAIIDSATPQALEHTVVARVRHLNLPTYPRAMTERGLEGVVEVQAHVDQAGHVTAATITRLDPPNLSAAESSILQSVRTATFYPSYADDKPADALVVLPFHFRIVDQTVSTFPFKRVAKSKVTLND